MHPYKHTLCEKHQCVLRLWTSLTVTILDYVTESVTDYLHLSSNIMSYAMRAAAKSTMMNVINWWSSVLARVETLNLFQFPTEVFILNTVITAKRRHFIQLLSNSHFCQNDILCVGHCKFTWDKSLRHVCAHKLTANEQVEGGIGIVCLLNHSN